MRIKTGLYLGTAAIALALALAGPSAQLHAQAPTLVAIDNDDIGGVVTGPNGPEAGIWVIAETKDLPTRFAKIVVTDDQGRYVLPDLPKAKYQIWVRGYGLVDSPKVESEPGKQLNLTAVIAPSAAAAAQYYPAIYWWSMLKIPEASKFGAKSDIPDKITQIDWIRRMKNNGCVGCHQMGTLATRTIPAVFGASSKDAWMRRIQAGQAGENMVNIIAGELGAAPLAYLADWTDRIAAGQLPRESPKRPQGVERNIVVTTWDWSDQKHYLHDLISTDKRNPTVNGHGPLFGQSEYSWDNIPMLDPVKNTATLFHAPIRDPNMHEMLGPGHAASERPLGPSAYWGEEKVWDTHINNHNATIDGKGRVWLTAAFRNSKDQPAWCKQDSGHPSAKLFPINESHRTLAILEPKTMKYTFIDTCFGTHHLNFAYDANETLWTSGGGPVLGWFNTKLFDETGDVCPRHQGRWQARRIYRAKPTVRSEQGPPHPRGLLRRERESGRRLDLGHRRCLRRPAGGRARRSGTEPAGDRALGSLLRSEPRFRLARRRHRLQGRDVDLARQRAPGQLRPEQVQGPAERTEGDRRPLPGRLDVLQVPGPGI